MPPIGDLSILVPVDVSGPESAALEVLEVLRPYEVVLLGYFPVPDQAEPALLKHEYDAEAAARLDEIATGWSDLTQVLVFTHDREATIDRVAEEHGCDAVLTAGDGAAIDRILVPIRGDTNLERIVSVVVNLLLAGEATVTFFHSMEVDGDPSQGEFLLRGVVEQVTGQGIDSDRISWQLAEGDDPHADIVGLASEYDIVVLGETEPSLRERIIGDMLSRIIDDIQIPALIVRDVE